MRLNSAAAPATVSGEFFDNATEANCFGKVQKTLDP